MAMAASFVPSDLAVVSRGDGPHSSTGAALAHLHRRVASYAAPPRRAPLALASPRRAIRPRVRRPPPRCEPPTSSGSEGRNEAWEALKVMIADVFRPLLSNLADIRYLRTMTWRITMWACALVLFLAASGVTSCGRQLLLFSLMLFLPTRSTNLALCLQRSAGRANATICLPG